MVSDNITHKDLYANDSRIGVKIPFTDELKELHQGGYFPLIEDPRLTKKTSFIGMFVLRPGRESWKSQIVNEDKPSLHRVSGWAYNIQGLDGGWMIANKNPMDAYRLALQYGLADAVVVGSTTAAVEGTPKGDESGYVWHPYNPASWPQLREADPKILDKIMRQREEFQKLGLLSRRTFPAQIVVTRSGKSSKPDILEASIFHDHDPTGRRIEAYILTSETGAARIRERAEQFGLEDRIEDILIISSPEGDPDEMDLSSLPQTLYNEYDIRIANHDGGATVLSQFAKAGILPQMNLTLTRQDSLYEVLTNHIPSDDEEERIKQEVLADFESKTDRFFGTQDGSIPEELVPVHIIGDDIDQAIVATFDSRGLKGKGFR